MSEFSRREFLEGSLAAGLLAALGIPDVALGQKGPNGLSLESVKTFVAEGSRLLVEMPADARDGDLFLGMLFTNGHEPIVHPTRWCDTGITPVKDGIVEVFHWVGNNEPANYPLIVRDPQAMCALVQVRGASPDVPGICPAPDIELVMDETTVIRGQNTPTIVVED